SFSRDWSSDVCSSDLKPVGLPCSRIGMGSCHSGTSTAMSDLTPRLYLASPLITDVELFAPQLEAACKVGDIAAVLLRLAASDERSEERRVGGAGGARG